MDVLYCDDLGEFGWRFAVDMEAQYRHYGPLTAQSLWRSEMPPLSPSVLSKFTDIADPKVNVARPGLLGIAPQDGPGVLGVGTAGDGVDGLSDSNAGVYGSSKTGPGVWATSETGEGIHAETNSPSAYAIAAYHKSNIGTGGGVYAESKAGPAGYFKGNVHVTGQIDAGGDITCANGGDCAEYFDVTEDETVDPGTVVVLDDVGSLSASRIEYDRRVVGVVSGAGSFKPGIILDKAPIGNERQPIALVGKVFCKVDASNQSIKVGDLLTTSSTPGHAMKATDAQQAFGAVMGKALESIAGRKGMIRILVTLQ